MPRLVYVRKQNKNVSTSAYLYYKLYSYYTYSLNTCIHAFKHTQLLLQIIKSIIVLFRQQRPCSTRYKSGTGVRYLTLANDPRRYFKCMSP